MTLTSPEPTLTGLPAHARPSPGGRVEPAGRSDHRAHLQARTEELLVRAEQAVTDGERQRLLDEVVLLHLPTARSIALRYRERGEPVDDLVQVASLGLVKAVRGYDRHLGTDFAAYAVPTITGEIKRHFRDRGWAVRPPRRLQDLRLALVAATQELTHELGRSPKVSELAHRIGVGEDEVVETLVSLQHYSAGSLDAPVDGDDGPPLAECLGENETAYAGVDDAVSVQPLLATLPPRDRHILCLRFFQGWTQSQIAADIGVTQMQVSRLLSRALKRLREAATEQDADAA